MKKAMLQELKGNLANIKRSLSYKLNNSYENNGDNTGVMCQYTIINNAIMVIDELLAEQPTSKKVETEKAIDKNDYWQCVASDYIDVLIDDEGSGFPKLTKKERKALEKEVAERLLNDDETWNAIDESLDWFVWHSKIVQDKRK